MAICLALGAMLMATPVETFADGVPASARAVLIKLYDDAATQIAAAVVAPSGRSARTQVVNRARAAALVHRIEKILAEVDGRTAGWLETNMPQAYRKGLATAVRQLKRLGLADADVPVQGDMTLIDRRTVAVIAADMAASLREALGDQAASAQRFLKQAAQTIVPDSELSRVVAQGAITGDVAGTYKAMRNLLKPAAAEDYRRAGQQLIQVGKATMTVKAYSEMLVRTRTRQATVQARSERLVANGYDLVTIVGAVSVNFCTAYLGRVYSITGDSDRYPSLSELPGGGPPFHPNCSKSTAAFIERFASEEQKQNAATPDRAVTTDVNEAQRKFKPADMRAAARRMRAG